MLHLMTVVSFVIRFTQSVGWGSSDGARVRLKLTRVLIRFVYDRLV